MHAQHLCTTATRWLCVLLDGGVFDGDYVVIMVSDANAAAKTRIVTDQAPVRGYFISQGHYGCHGFVAGWSASSSGAMDAVHHNHIALRRLSNQDPGLPAPPLEPSIQCYCADALRTGKHPNPAGTGSVLVRRQRHQPCHACPTNPRASRGAATGNVSLEDREARATDTARGQASVTRNIQSRFTDPRQQRPRLGVSGYVSRERGMPLMFHVKHKLISSSDRDKPEASGTLTLMAV